MRLPALFSSTILLAIVFGNIASAATYGDTEGYRYETAIDHLTGYGIVEGYADGNFKPNATINRAEMLKILMEAWYPTILASDLSCFDDIPSPSVWYANPVCLGKELGIVEGYAGNVFRPSHNVNLAEALKMAALTFQIDLPHVTGPWYATYLKAAEDHDVLVDLLDEPGHILTRGEMARIVDVYLNAQSSSSSSSSTSSASSASSSSSETLRHAFMNVVQQTSPVVTSVAAGKKDLQLLKFTAIAGRQDAILTSVTFEATEGTLFLAQNYRLLMDEDGNGTYETLAATATPSSNERLTFSNFQEGGAAINQERAMSFIVIADLIPTYSTQTFSIGFATDVTSYVTAQGAEDGRELDHIETNGVCPPGGICWISVDTLDGTQINIGDRGDLFVTDRGLVRNHQVLAGAISDPLLRIEFRADREDVDVETIRIEGGTNSIESLLLYRENEQNPFAEARQGQCSSVTTTRFCAVLPDRTLVIGHEEEVLVTVRARMKTDQQGAQSGEDFTLSLSSSTTSFPAIDAYGITSMRTLTQNDGDTTLEGEVIIGASVADPNVAITGTQHEVVFAKIGDITNADSRPDGSAIPVGQGTLGTFKITALANSNTLNGQNDVTLNSLRFSVALINAEADASSFKLASILDPTHTVPCTGGQSTGTFDVTCSLSSGTIQHRISQGMFATYALSATITNPQVSGGNSVVSVSLGGLGDKTATSSVNWSDEVTTFTWVDIDETAVDSVTLRG